MMWWPHYWHNEKGSEKNDNSDNDLPLRDMPYAHEGGSESEIILVPYLEVAYWLVPRMESLSNASGIAGKP